MEISFRPVEPEDFPLLLAWLARPHVREWWDNGDDTLEKVAAHYGSHSAARFIALQGEGRPIGYIQYYRVDADEVGVDMFLGEPELVGRGAGTATLRAFLGLVAQREHPRTVIVDPDPRNGRAIRCYTKVGFQPVATITNDDGHPALIMRLDLRTPTPHKEGMT